MTGGSVKMPGGYTISYPNGQSLNEQKIIQVDSDYNMVGGVAPTHRVPLTEEMVKAQFLQGKDVVLDFGVWLLKYIDNPLRVD